MMHVYVFSHTECWPCWIVLAGFSVIVVGLTSLFMVEAGLRGYCLGPHHGGIAPRTIVYGHRHMLR